MLNRFFAPLRMTVAPLRMTVVALLLLLAGHGGAWAQSNSATFPVNVTFWGTMNNGKYKYVIKSDIHKEPYDSGEQDFSLSYVSFEKLEFELGSSAVPLTMTVDAHFRFPEKAGDFIVDGTGHTITFTTDKYISGVDVTTSDDKTVSVSSITGTNCEREILFLPGNTFGKVTLTMFKHTPLDYSATIGGIESTYIDDGVNRPVPTVTYQENTDSAPVTLIEGVDYTVSYSVGKISGTVTVTGMGEYTGSKSKSYSIRQVKLDDFKKLTDGSYEIASTKDLNNLANFVNFTGDACNGLTFRQTADIDYTDASLSDNGNFAPIGCYGEVFNGTYDGQGHTISGITVSRTGDTNYDKLIGLFGQINSGGTVQNVVLASSTLTGYSYVGGIVGYSCGTIRNCRVENSVTINAGHDGAVYHGGIVGEQNGQYTKVIGCISAAVVSKNGKRNCECYGGIVGRNKFSDVEDCLYIGTTVTADEKRGAIVGFDDDNKGKFTNNYYTAINLGGVGIKGSSNDEDGARQARTVTLGDNVALAGNEIAYEITNHSSLTAIGTTALLYNDSTSTTLYSGKGQILTLSYTGDIPAGSIQEYVVTKTSGGSDVTADVLSGSTLTMPDDDVTVNAVIYAQGESESNPFVVTTWADLKEKMAAGGHIRLDADVTDPDKSSSSYLYVPLGKTVTLDLNGHTIDRGLTELVGNTGVISIEGTLTLNDSSDPSTGKITGGYSNHGGGVGVGGTFTMNGGAISGNTSGDLGGGVYVSGGTFTMNGGTITSNTARKGGGVYLTYYSTYKSTFTMNGGTISGNTANIGGGVYNCDNEQDNIIKVSDNPVISGNTNAAGKEENFYYEVYYMDDENNNLIIIYAPLSTGASIGVSVPGPPFTGDAPIEIATGATDGDSQYFHSDITCYTIEEGQGEQAGKLLLAAPASTPWSELKAQLEAGGTVTLADDVTALDCDGGYPYIKNTTVTLDLNGHNITVNENSEHVIFMDDKGNLTLTGSGTISGSKEYAVNCYYSTSTFTMNGGAISGSTDGGVYVRNGKFNVSGSPVITGNTKDGNACNVYLNTGKVINVTGPLSADARIGVTTKTAPTAGNPVTFAQGSGSYTLTAADASRFSSDVSGYFVGYDNKNHAAYLTVDPSDAGIVGVTLTGAPNGGFYWATYYNQNRRFTLPEGAAAYTMDASHHLYRLGTDGRTIKENTAVVIISDKAEIALTRTADASEITINGGGNILRGSNDPVPVASLPEGKSAYVLSINANGVLGFRKYTGSGSNQAIPANKAYYVK